jgi:hypothetical protein
MRFFVASLAAMAALVNSQSIGTPDACVVKSATGMGANHCQVVLSAVTDVIGSNPHVDIPKFDTTQFGAQTPILDAVWINGYDLTYAPSGFYTGTGGANGVTVEATLTNSWTWFSAAGDSKTFNGASINSLVGALSVDAVNSDQAAGSPLCEHFTDTYSPPQTTQCQTNGGAGVGGRAVYHLIDDTYLFGTIPDGVPQPFKAHYNFDGTIKAFSAFDATASNGVRVSPVGVAPVAGYSNAGPGAFWTLNFAVGATPTTVTPLTGGTAFNGQTGQAVSYNAVQSATFLFEVQYDYHFPAVGGDPQFAGFQGQNFQVHGAPESYFALISASQYFVNARFDYLSTGKCDYNETQCFTHPGTYMGMVYVGMKDAGILVQSGPHATGFAAVLINDKPMQVGERFSMDSISAGSFIHMISPSKLHLVLDTIDLTITNSDLFVNFDLALTDKELLQQGAQRHMMPNGATPSQIAHNLNKWYGSFNPLHGLIGQTWRNVKYNDGKLYQGDVTEYQLDKIVDHTFLYCVYEP